MEVGDCAGTGLARCIFTFVDRAGNWLDVTTIGEELEDGSGHAIVNRTRLPLWQTAAAMMHPVSK